MTSLTVMCYRYDCGILVLKFMEFWNGATLSTSMAEVKAGLHPNLYCLFFILSLNMKSVIPISVGQAAHVQSPASCAITA